MAYVKDMGEAANRHYCDGKTLQTSQRYDGAGYHYGFAAECAIKQQLINLGVAHDDAAIWGHFPKMRELAMEAIKSRRGSPTFNLLTKPVSCRSGIRICGMQKPHPLLLIKQKDGEKMRILRWGCCYERIASL